MSQPKAAGDFAASDLQAAMMDRMNNPASSPGPTEIQKTREIVELMSSLSLLAASGQVLASALDVLTNSAKQATNESSQKGSPKQSDSEATARKQAEKDKREAEKAATKQRREEEKGLARDKQQEERRIRTEEKEAVKLYKEAMNEQKEDAKATRYHVAGQLGNAAASPLEAVAQTIGLGGAAGKLKAAAANGVKAVATGDVVGGAGALASGTMAGFQDIVETAKSFVQVLNPGAIQMFNKATEEATAVIGTALEPVIGVATEVVRDFSAALMPAMQELRPVIEDVGGTMRQILKPAIEALSVYVRGMMPILRLLASALEVLSPLFQAGAGVFAALTEVTKSLIESFGEALGLDLKDTTENLKSALQMIIKYLMNAAVIIMRTFSPKLADAFIQGLEKASKAERERGSPVALAARDANFQDFSNIGREMAKRSLVTDGKLLTTKAPEEFLSEIVQTLKENKNQDLKTIIVEALNEYTSKKAGEITAEMAKLPQATATTMLTPASAGFSAGALLRDLLSK